jgi:hypothetical protein
MNELEVIRWSTRTPSRLVSSGLHPVATTTGVKTAAELSTTIVTASAAVSLGRTNPSRLLNSRAQPPRWAKVRDALSVAGLAAERRRPAPPRPAVPGADGTGPIVAADNVVPLAIAGAPVATLEMEGLAEVAAPEPRAEAAAANSASKPAIGTSKIELTIDSLRSYELVKPIPVFVESLGERHYVAEVPDLNITTSASSLSEILIVLKNSITQTYDELRIRKNQDPEQARQLKALEAYIGKSKRSGWLDRR